MKLGIQIRRLLKPEEAITLVFVLPFMVMALRYRMSPDLHPLTAICCFLPALLLGPVVWLSQHSGRKAWRVLRDFLPLALAVLVYENMHLTTGVVHLADKHQWLIAADEWLFGGVNPVVWLERWVNPLLTRWMLVAYSTYFLWPPLLTLMLYFRGQTAAFYDVRLAIVLTMYTGYLGYVAVPALDPWETMRERFSVSLWGSPTTNDVLSLYTTSSLKVPRDCFPSLHTAVTLVALVCAWRWRRTLFWVMLPCVLALLFATVYLRQHYVVDLIAAVPFTAFALWAAPRLNRWWSCAAPAQQDEEGRCVSEVVASS